jgi:hypothetical protein
MCRFGLLTVMLSFLHDLSICNRQRRLEVGPGVMHRTRDLLRSNEIHSTGGKLTLSDNLLPEHGSNVKIISSSTEPPSKAGRSVSCAAILLSFVYTRILPLIYFLRLRHMQHRLNKPYSTSVLLEVKVLK